MRKKIYPIDYSVSVVIPAYQAEHTINRAIKSILKQTLLPAEIVVIDDGSDDRTLEIVEGLRAEMGGIYLRFLNQNHGGAGSARNKGVSIATSSFVAFLDADDEWLPTKLERSIEELVKSKGVLVAHNYILCDKLGQKKIINKCSKNYLLDSDPYVGLYKRGYIATSSVVVRRDAIIDAGGFDENLSTGQDFSLWLSILKKPGMYFHVFEDSLLIYHITEGSITSYTNRRLECTLKIAKKFLSSLKGRPGIPVFNYWFRIVAIHVEAINAFRSEKEYMNLLRVLFLLPLNMIMLPSFIRKLRNNARGLVEVILWVWVLSTFLGFSYQFLDYLDPIMKALEVK